MDFCTENDEEWHYLKLAAHLSGLSNIERGSSLVLSETQRNDLRVFYQEVCGQSLRTIQQR